MAAEQVVPTHGQHVDEEDNVNMDVNDWLKENRLLKFKDKFEEYEINMDDLLNYSEQQIESVMKDCGITTSVHQIRFKDACRKLQAGNVRNENRIYRVIMTTKEAESVKLLTDKLTKNNDTMQENLEKTRKFQQNTEKYKHDIESRFAMLRSALNEREQILMKELENATNNELNELEKQKETLTMYDESIKTAQSEQNAVLLDPNINITKREMRIDQIATDTLNGMDDAVHNIHTRINDLSVNLDVKLNKEHISNIGAIIVQSQEINENKLQNDEQIESKINNLCGLMDDIKENELADPSLFHDALITEIFHPGNVPIHASATIKWAVKNTGCLSFGSDCKFVFVSGDGLLVSHYNIPNAKPNEIVQVSMGFNAFGNPGQYQTIFRLQINGIKFGPEFAVKIDVIAIKMYQTDKNVSYPANDTIINKDDEEETVSLFSIEHIENITPPKEEKGWFGSGNNDWKKEFISTLNCICGDVKLIYMNVKRAYKGKKVYCDICSKVCKRGIFHCPNGDIRAHPGGFDLCGSCGYKQLGICTNTPNGSESKDDDSFKYPLQLKELVYLGYDRNDVKQLLLKYDGCIPETLTELIKKDVLKECLCGTMFVYVDVKEAYKGKKVYCDICSTVCKKNIFHCPSGDVAAHPGGFDLCDTCGILHCAKEQKSSQNEMVTDDSEQIMSANKGKPPFSVSKDNYDPNFVYPTQLKQLLDMGFDRDKSRRLLLKNGGNMNQVLAELIK